jgi:hypothetical protein
MDKEKRRHELKSATEDTKDCKQRINNNFNVKNFVGQNLFKSDGASENGVPGRNFLQRQVHFFTGVPLIKTATNSPNPAPPVSSASTYLTALQQHLASNVTYFPNKEGIVKHSGDDLEEDEYMDSDDLGFVPRVLRPRRRKKAKETKNKSKGALDESNRPHLEIDSDDETRFLPTDLLKDGSSSDDNCSNSDKTQEKKESLKAKSPNEVNHSQLKHSESLRTNEDEKNDVASCTSTGLPHPQLRKTFSWASSNDHSNPSFSLFPKTSESDLLSDIRQKLVKQVLEKRNNKQPLEEADISTKKPPNNIEEALKNLRLGVNENSLSRKF